MNSRNGFDYKFAKRAYEDYRPTSQYYQKRRDYLNEKKKIEEEVGEKFKKIYNEYLGKIDAAAKRHGISQVEKGVKKPEEFMYLTNGRG